jgi:hypothetical protein
MGDLFTRRLVTADLTLSRYRALAALWEKGDQRLGDLAEASSFRLYLRGRKIGAAVPAAPSRTLLKSTVPIAELKF